METQQGFKSYSWVKKEASWRCKEDVVSVHCPYTCETCDSERCQDSTLDFKVIINSKNHKKSCTWFRGKIENGSKNCADNDGFSEVCRGTCGSCDAPSDCDDSKLKFKAEENTLVKT